MANKKFTDLDPPGANPTLADSDIMAVTLDPATTPVSRKTSISNLMGKAPVQSVNTATGAVVLDADDIDDTSTAHKFVTASDITNLSNLSGTNSGDQDLSSYQLQPAEGAFVDGDKTKLDNAVQPTDSINVLADVDTNTVAPTDGQALVWDNTASQWEPGPAGASTLDDLSDVTITSASNEDVIKFNGSSFVNGQVSVDVDTPLNTALRGTPSPHIGAFPNQSFKVTDNPSQSVMVIADSVGNLQFVVSDDSAKVFLTTPSTKNAVSVGFAVVEDSDEPDIEAETADGTRYSVISGDSDTKGANGLPTRQGFNLPDIGANPAPLLISGGTIS